MSRPEPEDRAPLVYVGATVGWAAGEVFPGIFVDVMDRVGNRGATRAAAAVALIEGDATEREARGEGGPRGRASLTLEATSDSHKPKNFSRRFSARPQTPSWRRNSRSWRGSTPRFERDPDVSPAEAHYLLGLAGRLTFIGGWSR